MALDALDLFADEALGDGRHDVGDRFADDAIGQLLEHRRVICSIDLVGERPAPCGSAAADGQPARRRRRLVLFGGEQRRERVGQRRQRGGRRSRRLTAASRRSAARRRGGVGDRWRPRRAPVGGATGASMRATRSRLRELATGRPASAARSATSGGCRRSRRGSRRTSRCRRPATALRRRCGRCARRAVQRRKRGVELVEIVVELRRLGGPRRSAGGAPDAGAQTSARRRCRRPRRMLGAGAAGGIRACASSSLTAR